MIKITKIGVIERHIHKCICLNCECEFTCDHDNFYELDDKKDNTGLPLRGINCPCCHNYDILEKDTEISCIKEEMGDTDLLNSKLKEQQDSLDYFNFCKEIFEKYHKNA